PSRPAKTFANVDLPEPFGPMMACTSPFFTRSVMPIKIGLSPTETCRFLISNTGSPLNVIPRGRWRGIYHGFLDGSPTGSLGDDVKRRTRVRNQKSASLGRRQTDFN